MEISKMLTISTAHIRPETAKFLDKEEKECGTGLIVYNKSEFGWFVFVPDAGCLDTPIDLHECLLLAHLNGCDWLCLDRDGERVDDLQEYEW